MLKRSNLRVFMSQLNSSKAFHKDDKAPNWLIIISAIENTLFDDSQRFQFSDIVFKVEC